MSTTQVYCYRAYGRVVRSNVELPGFQMVDSDANGMTVAWPEVPACYPGLDESDAIYRSHYHPAEGGSKPFFLFKLGSRFIVRWEELCDFEVSGDGSEIICHPWPGVTWGEVNPFIQGRILPLALIFQGVVTLHGAAVVVNGGAVALLGTSGTGKSTLGATFHALGHTLVADDLVAVWQTSEAPTVEWGPNHVRLDEKSMDYVQSQVAEPLDSQPDYDKTRVTLRPISQRVLTGLPLRTIYLLNRVDPSELKDPTFVKLSGSQALPTIMQGISNRSILEKDRQREQFELLAKLLSKVPVKQLNYPSGTERLPDVCNAVNADI